jgi:hypothetical protein
VGASSGLLTADVLLGVALLLLGGTLVLSRGSAPPEEALLPLD